MEQKKENDKKIILMMLILLAIIILIIIALSYLGKIENKQPIPTGNVDIFDVIFEEENKKEDSSTTEIENANVNSNNQEDQKMIVGKVRKNNKKSNGGSLVVHDNENKWSDWTKLNIFQNPSYFIEENKIAPTSKNSYQFVIRNNSDVGIKYSLNLNEINDYKINMKYKLKQNGEYVAGNDNEYVTFDKLNQYNINLQNKTYDVFTLDWKWIESSNDTEIGEQDIDVNYKLNLQISAMQIL